MKKTYCDVCGIECEDVERHEQPAIELAYSIEGTEGDYEVLTLPDICWDCRNEIANFIAMRMDDAKLGKKKTA